MHHVLLTLFMGGVVQPGQCPAGDLLRGTYETAIRRAFRKEIQQRDKALNRVTAHLAASYKDRTQAKDNAFKEAQALARRRADKARTLETTGASLSGTAPRTPEELQSEGEQALLAQPGRSRIWNRTMSTSVSGKSGSRIWLQWMRASGHNQTAQSAIRGQRTSRPRLTAGATSCAPRPSPS
jgi:hypothetical protein